MLLVTYGGESMKTTSAESAFPLYKQLIERIKYYLLCGRLTLQQKMAPPKDLSERLGINKNTIIAAYKQLESEGFLTTKNGQGTFVAETPKSWQDKTACQQLITLAEEAQKNALALGFSVEDWHMVVFNQTILEKSLPASIALDGETETKYQPHHMLFITDTSKPFDKIANEIRSYFLFYLPVKVCSLADLAKKLTDPLVVNAYAVYTTFPLVKEVEAIVKPARKTVIGLPYWIKSEYPWQ